MENNADSGEGSRLSPPRKSRRVEIELPDSLPSPPNGYKWSLRRDTPPGFWSPTSDDDNETGDWSCSLPPRWTRRVEIELVKAPPSPPHGYKWTLTQKMPTTAWSRLSPARDDISNQAWGSLVTDSAQLPGAPTMMWQGEAHDWE